MSRSSQPSQYINNAKTEVMVCHEAYLQGAINLMRKVSIPTAEHQAVIAMLEKCSSSMQYVSSQLAAANNTAKAQEKTIQFLRELKTPTMKEDNFVSMILCIHTCITYVIVVVNVYLSRVLIFIFSCDVIKRMYICTFSVSLFS